MAEAKQPQAKSVFYAHDKQLFTRSNGNAIHFSMRPCGERVEIKGMIEHGGGSISSETLKHCIRLAKSGSVVIDSRTVDSRYIHECVKENRLLNLDKFYLVRAEDSSSDSGGDSLQFLTSQRRRNEKKINTKRKEFTYEEDMVILNFICKKNHHADIGGNKIWQKMEKQKILNDRTWQSMSNRFKKTIRNRLVNYNISKGDKFLLEKKTEKNKNECWQNRFAHNSPRRNREIYESDDLEETRNDPEMAIIEEDVKTEIGSPKSPLARVRRVPPKNQMFLEAVSSNSWVSPRKRKIAESPPAATSKPPEKKPKENVEHISADHTSSVPGTDKPIPTSETAQAKKMFEKNKVERVDRMTSQSDIARDEVKDTRDSDLTIVTPVAAEKGVSGKLFVNQEYADLLNKLREDITNINIDDNLQSNNLIRIENEPISSEVMDVIDTENSDSRTPELLLDFAEGETSQTLKKVREKLANVQKETPKVSETINEIRKEILISTIEVREKEIQVSEKDSEVHEEQTPIFETEQEVQVKQKDNREGSKKLTEKDIPKLVTMREDAKVGSTHTEVSWIVSEVVETERAVRSETKIPEDVVDNDDQVELIARVQFLNMRRKEVKEYMVEEIRKNCGGKISEELFLSLISGTSKLHLVEMMEKDSPRRFQLLDSVPGSFGNPSDNDSFEEFF